MSPANFTQQCYKIYSNLISEANEKITRITYNHLNLPVTITVTGKGTITYTYDATGNKLKKVTVDNTVSPAKTTTTLYLGGAVYENDQLQFIAHEEGRIRPVRDANNIITGFVYDYFLKDDLGNVRMVLTEETDPPAIYQAGMEDANRTFETQLFTNIPETVTSNNKPSGFDADNTNKNVSQLFSSSAGDKRIGPGIVLKVMAGDKFKAKVYGWYMPSGTNTATYSPATDIVNGLITALSGGLLSAGSKGTSEELNGPAGVLNSLLGSFLNDPSRPDNTSVPKAYLNWMVLDEEQFQLVQGNYSAVQIPTITGTMQKQLMQANNGNDIDILRNGYLYVYVSNESQGNVYFDDLRVEHKRGPLLEETHYYPFGLTIAGISSKALSRTPENHKQFNGIEHTTDLDLNQYDAFYTTLDPQIGRFWQVDPKADSLLGISPYNSMVNNPISIRDPEGDIIKFDENASAEYKAKVLISAITLLVKGVGSNLIQLASSKRTYSLSEAKSYGSSFAGKEDNTGGTIQWNPNIALLTSNQIVISATTILNHELDHAAHYDNDPKKYWEERKDRKKYFDPVYGNIEEKRVITGSEQKTARAMGEITRDQSTRTDHLSFGYYLTQWPNSTTGTFIPNEGSKLDNIIIELKKKKSKN